MVFLVPTHVASPFLCVWKPASDNCMYGCERKCDSVCAIFGCNFSASFLKYYHSVSLQKHAFILKIRKVKILKWTMGIGLTAFIHECEIICDILP